MMLLKIAIRNIFRHRVRSTITISTIVFGCVALIFVGGFFEDLFWQTTYGKVISGRKPATFRFTVMALISMAKLIPTII
jgi:hypothetical protein